MSPSGKAPDFDSGISAVRVLPPQPELAVLKVLFFLCIAKEDAHCIFSFIFINVFSASIGVVSFKFILSISCAISASL